MSTGAVLFAGGTGTVGRWALRWFRERNPGVPVLVGGRSTDTTQEVARGLGAAEGVVVDLDRVGLGLGSAAEVAAVVMLAPDDALLGLRLAQDRGVPYLNIGNGVVELGPELASVAHRPDAAPVVLASHWLAGASLFLALDASDSLADVDSIRIGALFDEEDAAGPLALHDMERLQQDAPAALVFAGGRRSWLSGAAAAGEVTTLDGRVLAAEAYAPLDVISLHAATGAPDIRFDLTSGVSSSRRRGSGAAAEMVVHTSGRTGGGEARVIRSGLEFAAGQAALTGLSLVLSLEAVLGVGRQRPAHAGLYLPELLWAPGPFLDQLAAAGAVISRTSTSR